MQQPLVSIVLPVYNGSTFLVESIQSCIDQTYKNWELIIVNDCSTDNSLEIATNFAQNDERIIILDNEINLKLPASLNKGFSKAKGKYFTWTSHDNIFHNKFIATYVEYLEVNPEIGLLTGTYQAIDENGKMLYDVYLQDPQIYMPFHNPVAYAFMYKSETAKLAGEYNKDLFLVEDYEYWVRLWLHAKVARIEECLYYARVHDNTLTATRKKEIAQKLLEMRLMYFDKFNESLKKYPELRYKFFISIIENAEGFENTIKLYFRLFIKNPVGFGLKYIFIYRPKKVVKKIIRLLK